MEDDLRSEYDLKSLRVRNLGSCRKSFGGIKELAERDNAKENKGTESNGDKNWVRPSTRKG